MEEVDGGGGRRRTTEEEDEEESCECVYLCVLVSTCEYLCVRVQERTVQVRTVQTCRKREGAWGGGGGDTATVVVPPPPSIWFSSVVFR